ncbi:toll/interleukin-1 receptor domain-containing protein [Citreimonas salinaria]|uniref:TIR domain-containing protein n=1 Tax=Citreimonas salinaria TaxID=321339 RepID=A0A1H3IP85_9RHOB|nr:toll/interleukin-1 receptor domain-containing protein [Citreimonas salinaria]SDY29511.1 TIR domain-containing protein [Citreimonas salinaria]
MKIFISHSSKNAVYGQALVNLLTGLGVAHESIVFTSNTSYGIPVGNNIFDWLKTQISDRPFVIFLLSAEYYSSVACLNEMGAAWIVENQHAAIFTPDFDLSDVKFRDGALDPREIGFFLNDEDRVTEFIETLRANFEITTKQVVISQKRREFLENVNSLNPQDGVAAEKRGEKALSVQKPDESGEASNKELRIPDPSADLNDFEHQFLMGLFSNDEAHSNKVSEAYLETLRPEDLDAIGEWKSFCEFFKLSWSEHGDLASLAALSDEYGKNPLVRQRVAQGYLHFEDFRKAKAHFRAAIECTDDRNRKLGFLGELARISQKQGSREEVSVIVAEMRDLVDGPESEELLLAKLADLSDWYQDDVLKAAMLERELSIDPTDISKRFDLAYIHSQTGNEALSMFHYEKIPASQRSGMVWNNLGVAYQHFSLSGKSIDAFRKAAEKDETLAMSNLAYQFIGSGLLSEAEELLKEAQKHPSYHDNVASALVRLKKIPEEETKTHKDKLKGVSSKSDFLSHVGEHLWQRAPDDVPKTMIDPDCELDVRIEGESFVATGTFQKNEPPLVNALVGTSSPPATETYTVEYRGRFVGRVAIGERTKKTKHSKSAASTLLGLAANTQKFIIVIPEGAKKIRGQLGNDLLDFESGDYNIE